MRAFDSEHESMNAFFLEVADILKCFGLRGDDLRAGLVTFLALHSSCLGEPFGLLLVGEEQHPGPERIIEICLQLTSPCIPKKIEGNSWTRIKKDMGDSLTGRSFISYNLKKDQAVLNEICSLQRRGYIPSGDVPPSFVAISTHSKDPLRGNPSLVSISLEHPGEISRESEMVTALLRNQDVLEGLKARCAVVRKDMLRSSRGEVVVPYLKHILDPVCTAACSPGSFETSTRMIRLVARVNNRKPYSPLRSIMTEYDVTQKQAQTLFEDESFRRRYFPMSERRYLPVAGPPDQSLESEGTGGSGEPVYCDAARLIENPRGSKVTATRVDYYFVYTILGGDLAYTGGDQLTTLQWQILNIIWNEHLTYLRGNTMLEKAPSLDVLFGLIQHPAHRKCWPTPYRIYDILEKTGGPDLSTNNIDKIAGSLGEPLNFIEKVRGTPQDTRYRYRVIRSPAKAAIGLPHPSEIKDNTFGNNRILVENPLTGDVETI